jgi:membrane-bound lytic murein transglycosylase MltF
VLLALAALCLSPQARASTPPARVGLSLANTPWTGDLEAMLERRLIRILVPYSRTLFFNERGHERGITAQVGRELELFLNQKYHQRLGKRPLTVALLPTPRDQLLPRLEQGLGDIAAGNLTITALREETVDFVPLAGRSTVRELVVTGPASPTLQSVEDLSGKSVDVRASSSYAESLAALNAGLSSQQRAPAKVVFVPEELEDEDLLEMLNAGVLELTVVDDWKARIWARVLPAIRVREDLVLREEGQIGWAIRKASPELSAELGKFFTATARKWGGFDSRVVTFERRIKQIVNNTQGADWRRFQATIGLFERYGKQYNFDPLMLTAQGFQESRLRQEARSPVGAIGVMQLMPATGAEMKVGDVTLVGPNIHAGAKYMGQLMTRYFKDAAFDTTNRPLFAFASYNAGPGAISRLRSEAGKRGLDPDRWFDQVEIVVAEKIGLETTTYVRNIYKYYAAYRLGAAAEQARQEARQRATQSAAPEPK